MTNLSKIFASGKGALLSIILLLASASFLQLKYDLSKKDQLIPATIIPAKAIRSIDLGLHSAAASFVWISFIQELGNYYGNQLPEAINNLADIDPKFSYPYAFGTLILPGFGHTDQGIAIGLKGLENSDEDWRIPFYLAVTYHISKDRKSAALNFNRAASIKDAPAGVKSIAARYGSDQDHRSQTKAIWQSIYSNTSDEIIKESAKKALTQIEIIELLEQAASIYKQKYGSYPSGLDDLVIKGIIRKIPENPYDIELYINKNGQVLIR